MLNHFVSMFLLVAMALATASFLRLARWPFRLAFTLVCILGYFCLPGCATPEGYPYKVVRGGMNVDGIHEACNVRVEGDVTVLEACDVK